jgi:hypothetical protein
VAAVFILVGAASDGVTGNVRSAPWPPGHLFSQLAKTTHQALDAAISRDPFPFSSEAKGEEGSTIGQAEPRPLKISRAFTNGSANSFSHACSLKAHGDACPNWPSSKLSTQIAFCVWRS